jgi:hypothetical protein
VTVRPASAIFAWMSAATPLRFSAAVKSMGPMFVTAPPSCAILNSALAIAVHSPSACCAAVSGPQRRPPFVDVFAQRPTRTCVGWGDCPNQRELARYSGAVVPKSIPTAASVAYVRMRSTTSMTSELPRTSRSCRLCDCAPEGVRFTCAVTTRFTGSLLMLLFL